MYYVAGFGVWGDVSDSALRQRSSEARLLKEPFSATIYDPVLIDKLPEHGRHRKRGGIPCPVAVGVVWGASSSKRWSQSRQENLWSGAALMGGWAR